MAYTDIDDPTLYFNTVLYTGNATARDITTGLETTDFIWNKRRDSTGSHLLYDKVRGVNKDLNSESTEAEETQVGTVTAFGTDSFSLGTHGGTNGSGESKVTWCWSAGGTTGSSNTDGSITSTVSANTTSGFSIVSYTGTGANATVGHGLGAVPKMIIVKRRTTTGGSWVVYNANLSTGSSSYIYLQATNAEGNNYTPYWNATNPTSSVFSVGTNAEVNNSGDTFIAYCFAEKKGFSKFGSYVGNGSTDGTFVYTGFKPAFIIEKRTDTSAVWGMYDNKRTNSFNPQDGGLAPDLNVAEFTDVDIDFLSNGFKIRDADATINASGGSYIYMCFAESPFTTSTGIPTTAR